MIKSKKAYQFRLYPTPSQQSELEGVFGCCRFLWNQELNEHQSVYNQFKPLGGIPKGYKYKTEKEYKDRFPFLKIVDAKALQSVTANLGDAYRRFFQNLKDRNKHITKRKVGLPKFKSKKRDQSYTTYNINQNIKIDFQQKKIKVPKIRSWIRYEDNRNFKESIRHITLRKTSYGQYYVSILVEEDTAEPIKDIQEEKTEAFDMSAQEFLVSSTTNMINPRFYRRQENKIKRLHRRVSRKKKSSSNRYKARHLLSKKYQQITNQKKDWMHKTTRKLVDSYDAIIIEDLNIQGMQQFNSGLSKSITLDFSWHQFVSTLQYKMAWTGKHLIQVDRFFPSSQLCSVCGQKSNALILRHREWDCPSCHTHHQRDQNASRNLKKEGIRLLRSQGIVIPTVGTTGSHAWRDCVRPRSLEATVNDPRISRL
jgi:putative transposase